MGNFGGTIFLIGVIVQWCMTKCLSSFYLVKLTENTFFKKKKPNNPDRKQKKKFEGSDVNSVKAQFSFNEK